MTGEGPRNCSDLGTATAGLFPQGYGCASHTEFGACLGDTGGFSLQSPGTGAASGPGVQSTWPWRSRFSHRPLQNPLPIFSFDILVAAFGSLLHFHSRFCLCLSGSLPLSQSLLLPTSPSLIGTRVRETPRKEPCQSLREFLEKEFGQQLSLPPPLVLKLPSP